MLKKITVSSPGKLMLLGEHAVVYNRPCLVTAVDKRIYLSLEIIDKNEFQLEASNVKISGYKKPISELGKGDIPKGARFIERAVKNTLVLNSKFLPRHSGEPCQVTGRLQNLDSGQDGYQTVARQARMTIGVRLVTKSEFSCQFGFGSSSSSTVCTIKAVSEILGLNLSQKEIFALSYKTILDIQGKGSGFDVAAAVFGGTLYFVTGGKVIEPLKIDSLPLIIGYSGVKADTPTLINKVKESFANRQNRLEAIYSGIEMLVGEAKKALIKRDWAIFGELMNKNQDYLRELGVSIDKLDNMINGALAKGAYGAKLSGAGGGDCMIAVTSKEKRQASENSIREVGGEVINLKTNAEGVRIE